MVCGSGKTIKGVPSSFGWATGRSSKADPLNPPQGLKLGQNIAGVEVGVYLAR